MTSMVYYLMLLSLRAGAADMEQRAKELEAVQEGKSRREASIVKENRKIATERVNKSVCAPKPDKEKADKEILAEVGESKQIRGKTKQGVKARKRENEKGNHKKIQKQLRRKGLLELVDGFQSWALLGRRTWRSRWSYYKRFGVLKA